MRSSLISCKVLIFFVKVQVVSLEFNNYLGKFGHPGYWITT
jgi:hypothetical protein